jgi:hypothetical protein
MEPRVVHEVYCSAVGWSQGYYRRFIVRCRDGARGTTGGLLFGGRMEPGVLQEFYCSAVGWSQGYYRSLL